MSLEFLEAFNFINKETLIHKIDPRTKLILVLVYTVLIFLFQPIMFQLIFLFSILPFVVLSNLSRNLVKSIKGMSFLFFFILIINTLFISFSVALEISLRFVNLIIVFSIIFQTTPPDDITQALTKMHISYNIAFSLSLAFRFIPTIAKEVTTITQAQKSRGLQIRKGGVIQQLQNLFPLLIPLILNSIQRAYFVAESLESRSFGATGIEKTYLYPIKLKRVDYLLIILMIMMLVLGIILKINVNFLPQWLLFRFGF
ncbi:MAG: hypothetical protein GF364_12415 [Candidatus Lokiarchaeota archaeon]|nr:hypothetical protein [Candidatus Lokiarchaeota archaeon]